MRFIAIAAALALAGGCTSRARAYRFSSPLLGAADVPAESLSGSSRQGKRAQPLTVRRPVRGWQADAQQGAIRTVSARGIEATMPVASADAAAAITREGYARAVVWSRLPAPQSTQVDFSSVYSLRASIPFSRP